MENVKPPCDWKLDFSFVFDVYELLSSFEDQIRKSNIGSRVLESAARGERRSERRSVETSASASAARKISERCR